MAVSIVYDWRMTRNFIAAGAVVFAASLMVSVVTAQSARQPAKPAAAQKLPAPAGTLPPLPRVSFEPVRPMPVVQQVYEFAARHPEVLQYIPCYCGCERMGHSGNDDCFVRQRAANGRVIEWEAHGMGCAVCLDVGRKAMTMYNQGMKVADIRASIEREYTGHFPSKTPTPMPPKTPKKS
jgi:hypothetical protein